MWSQARNNRNIVRPIPAVPNTIYVITRSLNAMATIDINLSAEQVCSTERARRRSRKFKERATWHIRSSSKLSAYSALAIRWRLTHLLLSPDYYKTRPLILNSAICFPYSSGSVLSFYYFSHFLDYLLTTILHICTTRSNNNLKGSSMRHKEGKSQKFSNYMKTVSMESPFERLERHDDHAHSDETPHEKLVLPKRTQNLGPLLTTASGD